MGENLSKIKDVAMGIIEESKKKIKIVLIVATAVVFALIGLIGVLASGSGGESERQEQEANNSGASGTSAITNGSNWEKFLKYVLVNEGGSKTADGQYYYVEDDSDDNPTIGHGLCLATTHWEGSNLIIDMYLHVDEFAAYGIDSKALANAWVANTSRTDLTVSVDICDAIWENHLKGLVDDATAEYASLNLTEYQYYALADVTYRRGNTDGFNSKYSSLWSSSDDRYKQDPGIEEYSFSTLYSFFHNGTTRTDGVLKRKKRQWLLFRYGWFYYGENSGEYWEPYSSGSSGSYNATFNGGIEIYNADGSVNPDKIQELDDYLTYDVLHTVHHRGDSAQQNGPFPDWLTNTTLGKFQCPWWAYCRASYYLSLNGTKYKQYPSSEGDGKDYYANNKAGGWFNYGSTPKANSIICWLNNSSPVHGHVAYVEAVDPINKKVYFSHAGNGTSWYGITEVGWDGYFDGAYPFGYIYLDEPK